MDGCGFFDKATLGVKPLVEAASLYGAAERLRANTYLLGDVDTKQKEADQQKIVDYLEEKAIRINPDYAEAHCNLGLAFCKFGRYQDAVEAYKQAIRINPDFAEAY